MASKIKTTCSDCTIAVTLDVDLGTASAKIPGNGNVGRAKHVPAHTAVADLIVDDDLFTWDCPACGHADSFDPHF